MNNLNRLSNSYEWVQGMGETAIMDKHGRITIPPKIRKIVDKKNFRVELIDKNTIVLKAINNKDELIQNIKKIKLSGDPERSGTDYSTIKKYYVGKVTEVS
jgi:bifunctional DNA-binding transcriptional regulator/antitoxin component of YhaV-PrlF toxin-antitoxin module